MPDLLEVIAENDASVLQGWATAMKERAPQIESLPADDRRRELLTLAREFTRRADWAVDTAEGWLTELKTRLRDGMGGDKLRDLLRSGRTLCGMCRSVVEITGDLWRLCGNGGGESLPDILQRLTVVEAEIEKLAKRVQPPSPEELEQFFQRAAQHIQQGKGLTREQALAAIRKPE